MSLAHLGGQSRTKKLRMWIGVPTETFCEVLRGFDFLTSSLRRGCGRQGIA